MGTLGLNFYLLSVCQNKFCNKGFVNLYQELCAKVPRGYIILEMSGETPIELRLRNNVKYAGYS